MASRPPTALTIAGSDSGGGAGLQADLKTLLACGVHGMSAVTAVTVQNTVGVSGVYPLPGHAVAEQIVSVAGDIGVDAAKTGMLANLEIIEAIAETVRATPVGPLVVDPVCASQHGDPLLEPAANDALVRLLFPLATLVTPNLNEMALLTGRRVRTRADMEDAARALHDLGPEFALVKGGHLEDGPALDLLFDGREFTEFSAPRMDSWHTHGSGDTLAAAITAELARGAALPDAVAYGKAFVTEAVRHSYPLGAGRGPVSQLWKIPT